MESEGWCELIGAERCRIIGSETPVGFLQGVHGSTPSTSRKINGIIVRVLCSINGCCWKLELFKLESSELGGKTYAEVVVAADEVAVAASPSGTAHALVNIDPVHSTFFIGCQDGVINYNSSSTDYRVWKDL